jgi:ribosomal protein L32
LLALRTAGLRPYVLVSLRICGLLRLCRLHRLLRHGLRTARANGRLLRCDKWRLLSHVRANSCLSCGQSLLSNRATLHNTSLLLWSKSLVLLLV